MPLSQDDNGNSRYQPEDYPVEIQMFKLTDTKAKDDTNGFSNIFRNVWQHAWQDKSAK